LTTEQRGFTAELAEQEDPVIGQELILVRYDDGTVEQLRLHDYERVYSFPGLYEQIVQDRLGCRSPSEIATMLVAAVDRIGWDRAGVRVLDVAAGNGVSGEALAAHGLRPVLGTDIVPAARDAALRDRPGVYGSYLTLDLLDLSAGEQRTVRALSANALSCVAPVGNASQQLPTAALVAAASLLAPDALIAYMHDLNLGVPDAVTADIWKEQLGPGTRAELLERRRYVHRYTVNGEPFEMEGVVWRVSRGGRQAQ
jgi:hypothetical protein